MFLWCYSTAPPERSLSRRSETAGEVRKGLGFGVHPLRLQKTASLLHPLSRIAEFCFRLLLRFRSLTRPASSAHPSFLLSPPLNMYWVGWGGAQAFPRERITRVGLFARYPSLSSRRGYRLAVHTLAAEPPGLPGQASELYYEKIR